MAAGPVEGSRRFKEVPSLGATERAPARRPAMTIHLATGNAHKAKEFQQLADAAGLGWRLVPAASQPPVVEDAGTFAGNARKKAAALKMVLPSGSWVLADDSGLCVEALGGAPGVDSAYYAGPQCDSAANLAKLMRAMANVPLAGRAAHFICVLVLLAAHEEHCFEGRCDGRIAREPSGQAGFGYDPVFLPAGSDRSLAELGDLEKNKISHRALAWRRLIEWAAGRKARPAG